MRRGFVLLLAALLMPMAAQAQRPSASRAAAQLQQQPDRAPKGAAARRQALMARIFDRFMDRATVQLQLDARQRQQLEAVLRSNEARRRELAQEARQLRREQQAALRDPNTSSEAFQRVLDRMADVRARDLELYRSEQEQLARVLTPRQRTQFMALRQQFTEMVQQLRRNRAGAGRAPPDEH